MKTKSEKDSRNKPGDSQKESTSRLFVDLTAAQLSMLVKLAILKRTAPRNVIKQLIESEFIHSETLLYLTKFREDNPDFDAEKYQLPSK